MTLHRSDGQQRAAWPVVLLGLPSVHALESRTQIRRARTRTTSKPKSHNRELETFRATFEGRLAALRRADASIAKRQLNGASLRELLTQELTPAAMGGSEFSIVGADVLIPADCVLPLSPTFHELASNVGGARGTTCSPAPLDRFGTTLIKRDIAHTFGGTIELRYSPQGLRCTLQFPLPN